jgi:hypothetical protein
MASRSPALPRDSHVQSHAAVHKNELCDSHAHLVARAIAGGRTRPNAAICDFHNDGPTPCEEANRRIFIDSGFNVSYILPFG